MPDPGSAPSVTVVLCSRDRPEQLAEALPAVKASLGAADQLIVVDSASRGPETTGLAERLGVRCVRVERPGLARARNAGVREAATDVVAFTDDDCTPLDGWLDALREPFRDPAVGFVTGAVGTDGAGPGNSVLSGRPA